MSKFNYKISRLDKNHARKLLVRILDSVNPIIVFSRHSLEEIEKDDLTTSDVLNVLKSSDSAIDNGEIHNGSWRYRVSTRFIVIVISYFETGEGIVIVTAWDKRKKV